jgi:hypothetical protein
MHEAISIFSAIALQEKIFSFVLRYFLALPQKVPASEFLSDKKHFLHVLSQKRLTPGRFRARIPSFGNSFMNFLNWGKEKHTQTKQKKT